MNIALIWIYLLSIVKAAIWGYQKQFKIASIFLGIAIITLLGLLGIAIWTGAVLDIIFHSLTACVLVFAIIVINKKP